MVVFKLENGPTLDSVSTAVQRRVFTTATASIFINKVASHDIYMRA